MLHEHCIAYDGDVADVYVVEAGTDPDKLSANYSWYADWPEAIKEGLRYSRGMNFAMSQLLAEGKFKQYDAYLLLSNDIELPKSSTVSKLLEVLDAHPRVGILSPCSNIWGENLLLGSGSTKYFWFIHNTAYLLRREFVESVANFDNPNYMNFMFDGANFRGYLSESELIARAYANDWAAAITNKVFANRNQSYLLNQADLIKTEKYEENLDLYLQEGKKWLRDKYGFNSRWSMMQYSKGFYDKFFEFHPEYIGYKV
jgi:hypothetical protein